MFAMKARAVCGSGLELWASKKTHLATPREIPRPAGENAGTSG
jgi:hypothetical protein